MVRGSSTSDWNTLTILLKDPMQPIRYNIIMNLALYFSSRNGSWWVCAPYHEMGIRGQ